MDTCSIKFCGFFYCESYLILFKRIFVDADFLRMFQMSFDFLCWFFQIGFYFRIHNRIFDFAVWNSYRAFSSPIIRWYCGFAIGYPIICYSDRISFWLNLIWIWHERSYQDLCIWRIVNKMVFGEIRTWDKLRTIWQIWLTKYVIQTNIICANVDFSNQ